MILTITADSAELSGIPTPTAPDSISRYNHCFNGDHDIAQRGTSQTSVGFGSVDGWWSDHNGGTKTKTLVDMPVGYRMGADIVRRIGRIVRPSAPGAANYCREVWIVPDVRKWAGKTVSIDFWAEVDAPKNIAVAVSQYFGTGGAPSTSKTGLGACLKAATTSFARNTAIISIDDIEGKVIGTNEDSHTQFEFWFDAGSNFDLRTASLGQQSGTFDYGHVSIREGDTTLEDNPFTKMDVEDIKRKCATRFQMLKGIVIPGNRPVAGASVYQTLPFPVPMLKTPIITFPGTPTFSNASGLSVLSASDNSATFMFALTAAGWGQYGFDANLSAEPVVVI